MDEESTRRIGDLGERIAEYFLELKGFRVVRRNYRFEGREIDLLVRKGHLLVAVEVKLRRNERFGRAIESVDRRKVGRLRVALAGALREVGSPLVPRIDVITIDVARDLCEMRVRHIESVY